ncbi:hypothetical protein ACKWKO_000318 [Salmonella enterica subsp. enterica]
MIFRNTFLGAIILSCFLQQALADPYTEKFYRKVTNDEMAWISKQDISKKFNCSEYVIKKTINTVTGFSILSEEPSFSKQPIFSTGKVTCSIGISDEEKKELSFSAREEGTINGVTYAVSHTGSDVIGNVNNIWDIGCETRKPRNRDSEDLKVCFLKDLQFFIQRVPELKSINVPEGYVISVGLTNFRPITKFTVNNKEYVVNSNHPFIFGKNASDAIIAMTAKSKVSYTSINPISQRQSDEDITSPSLELIQPAVKILDRAYELYKK